MTSHPNQTVPIKGLFETHLTVSDLQRSIDFYRDKLGLQLALKVSDRNAAFFWIGDSRRSMLGLWSIGSSPLGLTLHIAFDVNLSDLLDAPNRLKARGISPLTFFGKETEEPSVITWMPAARYLLPRSRWSLDRVSDNVRRGTGRKSRNCYLVKVDWWPKNANRLVIASRGKPSSRRETSARS